MKHLTEGVEMVVKRTFQVTLDQDVAEFFAEYAERCRVELRMDENSVLPKGRFLSKLVRQAAEYNEWEERA